MQASLTQSTHQVTITLLLLIGAIVVARLTHPVERLKQFLYEHPSLEQLHIDDLILGALGGAFFILTLLLLQMKNHYRSAANNSAEKHQHYELLSQLPVAVAAVNAHSQIQISNQTFSELTRHCPHDEIFSIISTLIDKVSPVAPHAAVTQKHFDLFKNSETYINWLLFRQRDENYVLLGVDENHLKEVTTELSISRQIIEQAPIGILVTQPDMRIEYVNDAFQQVTGYSLKEVIGATPSILQSGIHNQTFYKEMQHSLQETGHWQGEIWNKRKSGEQYLEWLSITALVDLSGEVTNYIGMFSEITAQEHVKQKLRNLAYFDGLTSLANRAHIEELIAEQINTADDRIFCLLFIDIDGFKRINDSLGHEIGDELLVAFAKRLQHNIRETDIPSRWGGDEFIIGFKASNPSSDIAKVCENLLHIMKQPFWVKDRELSITVSIGVCTHSAESNSVEALIRNADTAMYLAKRKGKCRYEVFSQELHKELTENLEIEGHLRKALKEQSLDVHFQPQITTTPHYKVSGIEALARWHHSTLGHIPPGKFIPVAESTGLIGELGRVIIKQAFNQFSQCSDIDHTLELSVNLNATQLSDPDIVEFIIHTAAAAGISCNKVKLEITEDIFIEDIQAALKKLNMLKSVGFKISLDDFGTGYSSLSYLKEFDIDELKIDRSFVKGIERSPVNQAIIKAIFSMTDFMGIRCIVEGIETQQQLEVLHELNSHHFQGFLFSKPLPIVELIDYLNSTNSTNHLPNKK